MSEPITQAQDHDRRIGRLEGIAEQLTEQNRRTNAHLDRLEQALEQAQAEQSRRIDALRAEITRRQDSQFRWQLGIQFGIVGLLVSILLKLN